MPAETLLAEMPGAGFAGVPEAFEHTSDRAVFGRAPHRAGVELYRAHIVRHAFEPHAHEGFGLGAIESGVERFRYRGGEHLAPPGSLVLMNAGELHTGRAETTAGWRYRMVYVEPGLLASMLGERDWHFTDAVAHDPARALRISTLLDTLWLARGEPLAFDSALLELLQALQPLARRGRAARAEGAPRFEPVLEFMRENLAAPLTLEQLAAVAGLSPFHFLRRFKAAHHATPQQVLMALRVQHAKALLAAGTAPALAAADAGLADQAHLTRAFARRYGTTPGRYQRQLRGDA